ncbi:MAG: glucose-6-phosphate isomerase [Oceanicoccus sp.]|jgi:glucose-6-phosphate isomerase
MELKLDQILALGMEGLSPSDLKAHANKIEPYLEQFKARGQGFANLPKVSAHVLAVKQMAERLKGKFEDIVICGIGGSSLGAHCLRDTLKGPYWNMHGSPRLFVLDNLDLVDEVEKVIDHDKTLFIIISKSGRTPEPMSQYFYFKEKVSRENFVFITDSEKGELRKIADELKIPTLTVPDNVGGRFSVLTPVGLLPAALMGIDIERMMEGAAKMADSFMSKEYDLNLPFQLATVQYLLDWKHGIRMSVMMPYSTRLWTFADWYRQLLAESTGKDGKGLTPIRALGVTDQHSQVQLYNEGPTDKLLMFIEVEEGSETVIPHVENEAMSYLSGVTFHQLMNTEKRATEQAVSEYRKPNLTIKIPRVDEYSLGQLFMLFEASIAFLGEYYSIDAFSQPGVELGKTLTKDLLSKQK